MGVFKFTNKDFTGGNILLDNDEYLAEIETVTEEPKSNKPQEVNTVIDFKILGRVTPAGVVEADNDGNSYEEYRPVRNWYSAPWTILPLFVALGANVVPGAELTASQDTLGGQKVFLTLTQETITNKKGETKVVNKIKGYRPFVAA